VQSSLRVEEYKCAIALLQELSQQMQLSLRVVTE
jgi:hypothetical protein